MAKRRTVRKTPKKPTVRSTQKRRGRKPTKPAKRRSSTTAARIKAQTIDAAFKGRLLAVEPPINADLAFLLPEFRTRIQAALADLAGQGTPFKLVEGFRTVDRQQWLFGSGRPTAVPFGRPGPIVTNADGVNKRSNHQGNGTPGSGAATDCYPIRGGKVFIPPNSDPVWEAYAVAVEKQGLKAGHHFKSLKDSPHAELS